MNLNEEQLEIKLKLLEQKKGLYLIKGYAGTGKTTLVSEFIKDLNDKSISCLVTAPTHQAVKVLRKMFNSDDNEYCTIHSALALKQKIKSTGEISFVLDRFLTNKIDSYKYIFIDESSMLNDELFNYICNFTFNFNKIVIFIGDSLQIPPVGCDSSPVFKKEIQDKFKITVFELNKIVRQAEDNEIIKLSVAIRNNIHKNFSLFKGKPFENETIRYHNFSKLKSLCDSYYNTSDYLFNPNYIKILTWTNEEMTNCNNIVREILYKEESLNKLIPNEILITNDTVSAHGHKNLIVANNNEEIRVLSFIKKQKKVFKYNFNYYLTNFRSLDDPSYVKTIDIIHEDSENYFNELLEDLKQKAMVQYDVKLWKEYYKTVREFASVNYSYGLTTHRAQGSSYTNSIIIESNMNLNPNIFERNRLKYTACTRSRENLIIID